MSDDVLEIDELLSRFRHPSNYAEPDRERIRARIFELLAVDQPWSGSSDGVPASAT